MVVVVVVVVVAEGVVAEEVVAEVAVAEVAVAEDGGWWWWSRGIARLPHSHRECRRCTRYRCVRPQNSAQRRGERLLLRCRMRAPPRASCRKAGWASCIRQARRSSARPRRRLLPGQPTPVKRRSGTARVPEQSRRVGLQQ